MGQILKYGCQFEDRKQYDKAALSLRDRMFRVKIYAINMQSRRDQMPTGHGMG